MKKVFILIIILSAFAVLFCCNNSRMVQLYPVVFKDGYKVVNDVQPSGRFYKRMKQVLDYYNVYYLEKEGVLFVMNGELQDMNLIYNYTNKANDTLWLQTHKTGN